MPGEVAVASPEGARMMALKPDTTNGSWIHCLARYLDNEERDSNGPSRVGVYLVSVAITYLPLLLAVIFGPNTNAGRPFLSDWGVEFVLLVSFPMLVVMTVTDSHVLASSLSRIQERGILSIEPFEQELNIGFGKSFRFWNRFTHIVAILLGVSLAWATLSYYKRLPLHYWWLSDRGLLLSGYIFGYCLTLIYAVIVIYIGRSLILSILLKDLARRATFQMVLFHPDRCGGLQPIGQLGLRNQYILSILGLNIVILIAISSGPDAIVVGATLAYVVLGPIVFMGPLLPFRRGMLHQKEEWIRDTEQWLRREFDDHLRPRMRTAQITKEDEELVDRMRGIGAMIGDFPVWPFDATTLRKFTTVYLVPLAFSVIGQTLPSLIASIRQFSARGTP
jgi:hypothetical protein